MVFPGHIFQAGQREMNRATEVVGVSETTPRAGSAAAAGLVEGHPAKAADSCDAPRCAAQCNATLCKSLRTTRKRR